MAFTVRSPSEEAQLVLELCDATDLVDSADIEDRAHELAADLASVGAP
jgi:hypothetical protein